ncbi:hypothetical protein MGG_17863 [Pyricularia oryzae 70-15]|uniref:Uncharacterized protein n=1 Tax=Pyricularia oryzae (strain 70-15 / ATCC MYA-4617 / FGSC 8958) TaxID=242507 RepID=G4NK76_PYRO7|nr:uncharacterized protein MGG_17863 [Pyricularia oryzae 70-15]EHA45799.1 hypothetical protein MGG_17863 [Pyricularia oryzae 70-15]
MRTLHVGKGGLIDGPDALSFETIHATAIPPVTGVDRRWMPCMFKPMGSY